MDSILQIAEDGHEGLMRLVAQRVQSENIFADSLIESDGHFFSFDSFSPFRYSAELAGDKLSFSIEDEAVIFLCAIFSEDGDGLDGKCAIGFDLSVDGVATKIFQIDAGASDDFFFSFVAKGELQDGVDIQVAFSSDSTPAPIKA
jgi:hypothetical protein